MLVTGRTTLFVGWRGTIKTFRASVSKILERDPTTNKVTKSEDMIYEVQFKKSEWPEDRLEAFQPKIAYRVNITEGYLSFDAYYDKKTGSRVRLPMIVIKEMEVEKEIPFGGEAKKPLADEDLPF